MIHLNLSCAILHQFQFVLCENQDGIKHDPVSYGMGAHAINLSMCHTQFTCPINQVLYTRDDAILKKNQSIGHTMRVPHLKITKLWIF